MSNSNVGGTPETPSSHQGSTESANTSKSGKIFSRQLSSLSGSEMPSVRKRSHDAGSTSSSSLKLSGRKTDDQNMSSSETTEADEEDVSFEDESEISPAPSKKSTASVSHPSGSDCNRAEEYYQWSMSPLDPARATLSLSREAEQEFRELQNAALEISSEPVENPDPNNPDFSKAKKLWKKLLNFFYKHQIAFKLGLAFIALFVIAIPMFGEVVAFSIGIGFLFSQALNVFSIILGLCIIRYAGLEHYGLNSHGWNSHQSQNQNDSLGKTKAESNSNAGGEVAGSVRSTDGDFYAEQPSGVKGNSASDSGTQTTATVESQDAEIFTTKKFEDWLHKNISLWFQNEDKWKELLTSSKSARGHEETTSVAENSRKFRQSALEDVVELVDWIREPMEKARKGRGGTPLQQKERLKKVKHKMQKILGKNLMPSDKYLYELFLKFSVAVNDYKYFTPYLSAPYLSIEENRDRPPFGKPGSVANAMIESTELMRGVFEVIIEEFRMKERKRPPSAGRLFSHSATSDDSSDDSESNQSSPAIMDEMEQEEPENKGRNRTTDQAVNTDTDELLTVQDKEIQTTPVLFDVNESAEVARESDKRRRMNVVNKRRSKGLKSLNLTWDKKLEHSHSEVGNVFCRFFMELEEAAKDIEWSSKQRNSYKSRQIAELDRLFKTKIDACGAETYDKSYIEKVVEDVALVIQKRAKVIIMGLSRSEDSDHKLVYKKDSKIYIPEIKFGVADIKPFIDMLMNEDLDNKVPKIQDAFTANDASDKEKALVETYLKEWMEKRWIKDIDQGVIGKNTVS